MTPEYGKALKRSRSGVDMPDANEGRCGDSRSPLLLCWNVLVIGERTWGVGLRAPPIVVLRTIFEVSDEGGGGRFASEREEALSMDERQRKHSPVPK